MRIVICGSMTFADKFVETYEKLKEMGHEPVMDKKIFEIAKGEKKPIGEDGKLKRQEGLIKQWYEYIKNGDAILVLNYDKKEIKNYIGGNTLMEIGFAHVLNKKVFLLNSIPKEVSYSVEIEAMTNIVLEGNLEEIK